MNGTDKANRLTEVISWAKSEVERLRSLSINQVPNYALYAKPLASAALEILGRYANGTAFYRAAGEAFARDTGVGREAVHAAASALDAWIQFVEAGLDSTVAPPVQARLTATNDLMEQVQALLDDSDVHVAAPVVLAGAALEEFLRSRAILKEVEIQGVPNITKYATALRNAGDLSTQEIKDITAWAGQRNQAAHGQFNELTRERAQIMVDGINLFFRQRSPQPGAQWSSSSPSSPSSFGAGAGGP